MFAWKTDTTFRLEKCRYNFFELFHDPFDFKFGTGLIIFIIIEESL